MKKSRGQSEQALHEQVENEQSGKKRRASLLRHPVFGRTFTAYSLAVFGDWFDAIAIQVLIGYRWQASPLEIALVPVCMAVPGLLFGAAAGAAADRWDKLKLMRVCDLLTALATIAILFVPNIVWLLPLLTVRAALGVFNVPAQQALTRRVVSEERLLDATSLNGLVGQLSRIAGPLMGAAVLALLSPQACIAVNAVVRLFSYVILRTVPKDAISQQGIEETQTVFAEKKRTRAMLREGWVFVRRTPILRNLMLFALLGMLAIQTIDFQFVSLFRHIAPDHETAIGWLLASSGAAAAAIAAANMRFERLRHAGWAIKLGGSYALLGLSILVIGLLPVGAPIYSLLITGLLLGMGNGLFMITFNHALQQETPPELTGRVFGIQSTVFGGVMIAAPPLGGLLVQQWGPGEVFAIVGLLVFMLGLTGLLFGRKLWPVSSSLESDEDARIA
ncbi:MFS transporter [Saccharibacillus sacchari]|uniref:MFS transporter n=1 Tax=Saccharibacillus sacchari TaxID=456493 RepID=UPI0004BCE0BC|nr:MFS transporter [Saccharibacillus sacchari]